MKIKGLIKTSLLDYPGHIAASIFCGGCNFRCPNCHNSDLVLHPDERPDIAEEEVLSFLKRRRGLLDGVVISGGEPTLQSDLIPFAARLREMGFAVKLDTNGYRPDVLREAIAARVFDYVAMDVKAPPDKYALATGVDVDVERIELSIALLRSEAVDYEFRTTVVPGLLDQDDIVVIARWIAGARRYYLQQFVPRNTLDPAMLSETPYLPAQLQAMAEAAAEWVGKVEVRGI